MAQEETKSKDKPPKTQEFLKGGFHVESKGHIISVK